MEVPKSGHGKGAGATWPALGMDVVWPGLRDGSRADSKS